LGAENEEIMRKYHGGDAVDVGFYFNIKKLEMRLVSGKKPIFPTIRTSYSLRSQPYFYL